MSTYLFHKRSLVLLITIIHFSLSPISLAFQSHDAGEKEQSIKPGQGDSSSNLDIGTEHVFESCLELYSKCRLALASLYEARSKTSDPELKQEINQKIQENESECKRLSRLLTNKDWSNIDVGKLAVKMQIDHADRKEDFIIFPGIAVFRSGNYWIDYFKKALEKSSSDARQSYPFNGKLAKVVVKKFLDNHTMGKDPRLSLSQRDELRSVIQGFYKDSYSISKWKPGMGGYIQAGAMLDDWMATSISFDVVDQCLKGTRSMEEEAFLPSLMALDYYSTTTFGDYANGDVFKKRAADMVAKAKIHESFSKEMRKRWDAHYYKAPIIIRGEEY